MGMVTVTAIITTVTITIITATIITIEAVGAGPGSR
jgi:hypothetical protein